MLQKKFHPFHIKDKAQKYKKKQCVFYFKKSVFLQPKKRTGCGAVGSALRSGRRGRKFESSHPDIIQKYTATAVYFFVLKSVFLRANLKIMRKETYLIVVMGALLLLAAACSHVETTYYPNGATQSIIHYKGKKEHGRTTYFFSSPNTVEIEVDMKNGKRNGEFRRYFKNGLLDTYCVYVNDSIEGLEVMYLPNGCKSQEFTYLHGRKDGPHKAYHIDGSIKVEGGFKNDLFDGPWTYYDERGVVVGEGKFQNGDGEVTFYDKNGHPARTTHYKNNKKEGAEVYYTPTGEIFREITFKEDRIIDQKTDSSLIR